MTQCHIATPVSSGHLTPGMAGLSIGSGPADDHDIFAARDGLSCTGCCNVCCCATCSAARWVAAFGSTVSIAMMTLLS